MIILIDTCEQRPYTFSRWKAYCVRDTLKTGDYSVLGYQDHITVERKSLNDFYRSIGAERSRVLRSIRRMTSYQCRLLVVESSATSVFHPEDDKHTKLHKNSVWGSVTSILCDFGVPVFLADTRKIGEEITYRFLKRSLRRLQQHREGSGLPARFVRIYSWCSICGKSRAEALHERPDLSITAWVRMAKKVDKYKRTVLGDRLAVCYECRKRIRTKDAVLPPNYQWE